MNPADYFSSHPPRCIAEFVARPTDLPGVQLDGHASMSQRTFQAPADVTISAPEHINLVFALSCQCGGSRHFVHGYRWTNPDVHNAVVFLSPLSLECAACGKKSDLFDADIHGHDAELGYGTPTVRGEGSRAVSECPTCGRQPLEAFVRFEYPDDLLGGHYSSFAGREQDLFTWFSLVGRCSRCSKALVVAELECA
jgi:hypothetical protein